MSDGREERKEQEERRQWEEERKKRDDDRERDWERDGDRERRDSRAVESLDARTESRAAYTDPVTYFDQVRFQTDQAHRDRPSIWTCDLTTRDEAGDDWYAELGYYWYTDAHNLAGFGLLNSDPLGSSLVKHVQWK